LKINKKNLKTLGMSTSNKAERVLAQHIWFSNEMLFVKLSDDREIGVPLSWFPSLEKATEEQRKYFCYWLAKDLVKPRT
jgi:hypothetical protein